MNYPDEWHDELRSAMSWCTDTSYVGHEETGRILDRIVPMIRQRHWPAYRHGHDSIPDMPALFAATLIPGGVYRVEYDGTTWSAHPSVGG